MKYFLPLILLIVFSDVAISQTPMQKQNHRFSKIFLPAPQGGIDDIISLNIEPNPFVNAIKAPDVITGKTRYDLQSNYAVGRRIHAFPDGTIGATWTRGMLDPNFTDRGTGYNYHNGSSWGPHPTERVEAVRTGWPSYQPYGTNGEIIVSHTGAASGLVFSWRENKGTGSWNYFNFEGPSESPLLLWPRMITSGENNEIIHLIVLTAPTANGGVVYQGLDGALLYSRSFDGGSTWDPQNELLEGITSDDLRAVRADTYSWAAAHGETLAFIVGEGYGDGIVMKSDDAGDSWTKMLYYESIDKFMDGSVLYPDHGGTDSYQSAVIDDLGRVHVAVGRQVHNADGIGGIFYFPTSNGLLYWNETMAPMDTTIIGSAVFETTGVNPAYLLAEVYDNGVDTVSAILTPNYYASLTSMPQLTFDYENKILYAVYSAISPGFVNADEENYRHIWFRFSDDYGVTWSPYQDLTGDIFHLFTECVYPSVSSNVTDKVHIIYQSDNYIGGSNRPDPPAHVHVDNDMVYLSVNTVVGINESQEQLLKVNQIFPNPANSIASITIHVDKPLTAEISLLNILGQQVLQSTRNFGYVGEHLIQLKIDNLDAGIYFVKVQTGKQSVTKKIIIE